mmetsp:Transcript_28045/g.38427  ORF Transcript_28045/g.38427 Transcript_28045/m.38427 type:complete len:707 (-) Transcript_28045:308-2428(-)|eukprot:CAMPEP_0185764760 /NCGR_PEP_ID=MMETSP1174-20130828/23727_1 /TAXON_ID=35687 /ORGANISM="Dictyocha speculum, Strain CCMP1381" /LENGTH=706 /DNA_ID=CAMNT_0028447439 /DNA_START=97 /DNA_END=2217 /DNA_ORIENTATION=+
MFVRDRSRFNNFSCNADGSGFDEVIPSKFNIEVVQPFDHEDLIFADGNDPVRPARPTRDDSFFEYESNIVNPGLCVPSHDMPFESAYENARTLKHNHTLADHEAHGRFFPGSAMLDHSSFSDGPTESYGSRPSDFFKENHGNINSDDESFSDHNVEQAGNGGSIWENPSDSFHSHRDRFPLENEDRANFKLKDYCTPAATPRDASEEGLQPKQHHRHQIHIPPPSNISKPPILMGMAHSSYYNNESGMNERIQSSSKRLAADRALENTNDLISSKPKWGRETKRRKISVEEKAEITRRRNREHARSTRRNKKIYVECLKQQVTDLLAKQNLIDSGTYRISGAGTDEKKHTLKSAVKKFLQYRCSNVLDPSKWREIVEDTFVLAQPRTPFRAVNIGKSTGDIRRVKGIDSLIQDTRSIAAMLDMIRSQAMIQRPDFHQRITMTYRIEPQDLLASGDRVMCHWIATTTGLVAAGFPKECLIDGMLKCKFNAMQKILSMNITYDVISLSKQLEAYSLIDRRAITESPLATHQKMKMTRKQGKAPSGAGLDSSLPEGMHLQQPIPGSSTATAGLVPSIFNLMGMGGRLIPPYSMMPMPTVPMKLPIPTNPVPKPDLQGSAASSNRTSSISIVSTPATTTTSDAKSVPSVPSTNRVQKNNPILMPQMAFPMMAPMLMPNAQAMGANFGVIPGMMPYPFLAPSMFPVMQLDS